MLHIAPEPSFEFRLRRLVHLDYITFDMQDVAADVAGDIHKLPFPEDHFDVIHCSHVLEHVRDDRLAMKELARVLKPGGWTTILVPIIAAESHEDPRITDPQQRARLYGQWDHVRAYGLDVVDRLRASGFDVECVAAADLEEGLAQREQQCFGDERLFLCRV